MMRQSKCEKIDGNGNVRNLMAMEMKMWEDLSARKPINTPEIVNVMIKAGPASTSNKIISNEPSQRNPFFWSKAIKIPCVGPEFSMMYEKYPDQADTVEKIEC